MDPSTITVSRVVAGPPEWAFAAWTDVEQLAAWWWPQLSGTTYDVDARRVARSGSTGRRSGPP